MKTLYNTRRIKKGVANKIKCKLMVQVCVLNRVGLDLNMSLTKCWLFYFYRFFSTFIILVLSWTLYNLVSRSSNNKGLLTLQLR